MKRNVWLDGMFGVVVGDALGCPVEFADRSARKADPVVDMRGYGTFNLPKGSWTDDSSMALATLDSIVKCGGIDLEQVMNAFVRWLRNGEYTPFGDAFDVGNTCFSAIARYGRDKDPHTCGGTGVRDNGNGSLMRIMPACLYCYAKGLKGDRVGEAIKIIHEVSGLTHNHMRAKIACGLYYFMVCEILDGNGELKERLQKGLDKGFEWYEGEPANLAELALYGRIKEVEAFALTPEEEIRSGGYVVESLEATVWCLARTKSYEECTLLAVNLGGDTDTTAAIAGGLAGLYYGVEGIPGDHGEFGGEGGIPTEWIGEIKRRKWIWEMCENAGSEFC